MEARTPVRRLVHYDDRVLEFPHDAGDMGAFKAEVGFRANDKERIAQGLLGTE